MAAQGSSAPRRASGSGSPGRTARARDEKKGQERERSRERDADTGVNRGKNALEAADSDSKQDEDMSVINNSASSEEKNITAISTANGHKRQAVSAAAEDSSANFNSANRFSVLDVEPSGEDEDSADDTDLPEASWKKARASRAAADPRLAELAAAAGQPSEVALDASELSARLEFISIWLNVSEECTSTALYAFVCNAMGGDMYERFHAEWVACEADRARERAECSQTGAQHAAQHAAQQPGEPRGRALVSAAAKMQAAQQRGPGAAAVPLTPASGPRKIPAPRPRDGPEAPPSPSPALPQQQRQQLHQQHAGGSQRPAAATKPTGPTRRAGGRRCAAATNPGRPKGTGPQPTPFLRSVHIASGLSLLQWRSPGGNGWQVLLGSQQPPPEGWPEWRLRMAAHGRWWLRSGADGSGAVPRGSATKVAPDARKLGGAAVGAAPHAGGRGGAPAPGSYAASVGGGNAASNGAVVCRVAGRSGGSGGGRCAGGVGGSGRGGGGSGEAPRAPAAVSAEAFAQMQVQLAHIMEMLAAQQAGARSARADWGAAAPSTAR